MIGRRGLDRQVWRNPAAARLAARALRQSVLLRATSMLNPATSTEPGQETARVLASAGPDKMKSRPAAMRTVRDRFGICSFMLRKAYLRPI